MNIPTEAVTKITNAALEIMAARASIEEAGQYGRAVYSAADIAAAVIADPAGNVAFRLAELVALGIEHYCILAA